ncbi:transmembrane protein 151B-like isoform X2 [Tubulanus polymorphus]|uniref:transmembrane protein 151B-like isoform X2 n=1 Tax=Tubulanus polymorphus TaxID=672921 RepID=UPI003DA5C654
MPAPQRPIRQSFCGSLRRDTHWKCLILTLLIWGCMAAITWCRMATDWELFVDLFDEAVSHMHQSGPCDDGYVYIPVAFVVMLYLVYLVECWHCHTRLELQCKVDISSIYERVQFLREAIPIVWWKAICYHYVRRTRQVTRYRNGDAFTTTQVYYERVNSHTAGCAFNFTRCGYKDISKTLRGLEDFPATKIRFTKGFSFATVDAESEFEDQRAQFFQDHERRDDYMETREGMDLLNINFKEYLIAFADPNNLPWYISHPVFWVASIFMMSWPIRVLIEYKTAYLHFHAHKLFGTNYLDPGYIPGQMSRVSTMCSTDLEMNIRNNFTMVPSYSEVLLMDCASGQMTREDSNGNITPITPNGIMMNTFITTANAVPNGFISNGHIPYNANIPNGASGHVYSFSDDNDMMQSERGRGKRRRKKKKKSKRCRSDIAVGEDGVMASCAAARTTPSSATSPDSVDGQAENTPHAQTPTSPAQTPSSSIHTPGDFRPGEMEVRTRSSEEEPPPYETALTMQVIQHASAPNSQNNSPRHVPHVRNTDEGDSLATRPQPQYGCMETSL